MRSVRVHRIVYRLHIRRIGCPHRIVSGQFREYRTYGSAAAIAVESAQTVPGFSPWSSSRSNLLMSRREALECIEILDIFMYPVEPEPEVQNAFMYLIIYDSFFKELFSFTTHVRVVNELQLM